MLKLNDLKVSSNAQKPTEVFYDKARGVSFDMVFIQRTELQALIAKCTKTDFDKQHRPIEKLDDEKLTVEVFEKCIKGWKGMTFEYLSSQMVLDTSKIADMNEEVPFTQENLQFVAKNVYGLDNWLLDSVRDAANFNQKKEAEVKN